MGVIYLKPSDVQEQIDKIKQMGGNARFKLVGGTWLHGQYWDLYIDRINPETNKPQKNFKVLSYKGLAEVSSELDRIIATTRNPELLAHPWYRGSSRLLLKNPPFYAHNLYEKKTHGLTLKQMRRLYAMVSRGNQKAITYARNVLGIPFSESPSQVKAVVLHHVRDLAERKLGKMSFKKNEEYAERWLKGRLRGNPASSDVTPVVFRTFRSGGEVIALFPYEPGTMDPWTMMSYQHIGQHGPADMGLTAVHTRPSTPDEIRPLKNELERIGYKLKILKRIPGDAVRVRAEKLRSIK